MGSDAHTTWLKDAVEAADVSVTVLGGVPKVPELVLPERHLGLHMPGEGFGGFVKGSLNPDFCFLGVVVRQSLMVLEGS